MVIKNHIHFNSRTLLVATITTLMLVSLFRGTAATQATPTASLLAVSTQDDAGSHQDAGDTFDSALPVSLDVNYTGNLGPSYLTASGDEDFKDMYTYQIASSGYLHINVTVATFDQQVTVSLYQGSLGRGMINLRTKERTANITLAAYSASNYTIAFQTLFSSDANYSWIVEFTPSAPMWTQSDGALGHDSTNTNPVLVDFGSNYTGFVGEGLLDSSGTLWDTTDYYRFTISTEGTVSFSVSAQTKYIADSTYETFLKLRVVDGSGYQKSFFVLYKPGIVGTLHTSLDAGTYTLQISSTGWNTSYWVQSAYEVDPFSSQDDGNSGRDAGESYETAVETSVNSQVNGTVGSSWTDFDTDSNDFTDYFLLTAPEEGILTANISVATSSIVALQVSIYPTNGTWTPLAQLKLYRNFPTGSINATLTANTEYIMEVTTQAQNYTYSIDLSFKSQQTDNSATDNTHDTNSILSSAQPSSNATPLFLLPTIVSVSLVSVLYKRRIKSLKPS